MHTSLPTTLILFVMLSMTSLGCADVTCTTDIRAFVVELEGVTLDEIDTLWTEQRGEGVPVSCDTTDSVDIVRCIVPDVLRSSTLRLQLDLEDGRSLGFEEQLGGECHPEPNPLRIRVPAP